MKKVKVSAVQMSCTRDVKENIDHAERLVREAVRKGASIILLPELFERQYFCQERVYDYYSFAKSADENEAMKHFKGVCAELGIVLIISFFERDGKVLYNSCGVIDSDGSLLGIYRKTHIPDDHYYQEKFYFTPGNTGFKVFKTAFGNIGVGICWDQWFPETARALAINGAELLFFPTAIGSEPILEADSAPHWRRAMQGHAASNVMPVIAANRYGLEEVQPSKENGGQESALLFYGSSFIADETGDIVESAGRDSDEVLIHEFDLDEIDEFRLSWGIFRDRRPECYGDITR